MSQKKLPINWPGVNENDKWALLDETVESQLPKSGVDTLVRLRELETKVYEVGVELFGVVDRNSRKAKGKGSSRRAKE